MKVEDGRPEYKYSLHIQHPGTNMVQRWVIELPGMSEYAELENRHILER